MKAYFISDLHLDESRPTITTMFLHFLQNEAKEADALYILGDLFEAWIGDDEKTSLQIQIREALKSLAASGVSIYFICGNRDFLLGRRYADKAHMTILPDHAVIDLYGKKALIMHGDTLCTLDEKYQAFRKKARNKFLQKLFLALPLWLRKKIGTSLRSTSQAAVSNKSEEIMDVTPSEVDRVMQKYEVDLLIHGHTHRERIHPEKQGVRIVLGAWHDESSVLTYDEQHHFCFTPSHTCGRGLG